MDDSADLEFGSLEWFALLKAVQAEEQAYATTLFDCDASPQEIARLFRRIAVDLPPAE